jgi:hypothetical protein
MAHAFHTLDRIATPQPSMLRQFGGALRAVVAGLARAFGWPAPDRGGVSVSDVSAEWLLQHEIRSSKHQDSL